MEFLVCSPFGDLLLHSLLGKPICLKSPVDYEVGVNIFDELVSLVE